MTRKAPKSKPVRVPQPKIETLANGVRYMPPIGEASLADAEVNFKGLGFERVQHLPGSTYQDSSTVIIVPSRDMTVDLRVQQTWQGLMAPMNQKRAMLFATGDEVGHAYTNTLKQVLADPVLGKWKYIMTLETDNLIPPDAHIKLLRTIEAGQYDGVSGIYYTKGEFNMPMAYGSPEEHARTGVLDFKPLDIREAQTKGQVVDVNGIAMGCSLYRMSLFHEIEPPWFVTVSEVSEGGPTAFTQDLWFCKRAREKGKRFAVDLSVVVGHLDLASGVIY